MDGWDSVETLCGTNKNIILVTITALLHVEFYLMTQADNTVW